MFNLNKLAQRRNNVPRAKRSWTLLFLIVALTMPLISTSNARVQDPRVQDQSNEHKGKFRPKGDNAIPNQYIVVLKDDTPRSEVASIAADLASRHNGTATHIFQYLIKGFLAQMPEAAAKALSLNPMVEFVEQDGMVYTGATQFNPPWGLDRIDQRSVSLSSTYSYTNNGGGVNVYVIDSGIRLSHQEFYGRAFFGYDVVNDGRNGDDCFGHGTHVAGTIGGATYGVAKGVRLYSVRAVNCVGTSSDGWLGLAADWVGGHHIKPAVANLSVAGPPSELLDMAVRRLVASGVTTTVAAGNGYLNDGVPIDAATLSPSRVTEALTVSATGNYGSANPVSDQRASFANYGSVVDVFAPGVGILSAGKENDTFTFTSSGTSMATPHVAGVAALFLQTHPGATPNEVAGVIKHTATKNVVSNPGPGSPSHLLFSRFPMGSAVPLYRYWNPSVTDHFYTLDYNSLRDGDFGWSIEKIECFIFKQQQSGTVPLYRYWNPSWGDHYYTTNFNELGNGAMGWTFEKIEGYIYSQQLAGTIPLYRYWNSSVGDHFYTTTFNELGNSSPDYVFEKIEGYVLPTN